MADEAARPVIEAMRPVNYHVMFDVEDEHWWSVGRREIVFAQIEDALKRSAAGGSPTSDKLANAPLLSQPPTNGREARQILDIGCGTGINLDHLKRYGSVQGVDLSGIALDFCRRRGHERVLCASATELPFAAESFDLVTALDVIEHLDDDLLGLGEICRVLRPGAPAVLFVPAFQALWGPNDDQSHHKRRYRLRELRARVEAVGLKVERISYANIAMFVPIWAGRKLMNALGVRAQAENRINHPLINRLIARVFAGEAGWLRRHTLPFGVSIVCVARKEEFRVSSFELGRDKMISKTKEDEWQGRSAPPTQSSKLETRNSKLFPTRPQVSVFLPVYNEEENLAPLHQKILAALERLGESFEVIYVDDGSTDGSLALLARFASADLRVRVVSFRRNYGQTAAMAAGIDAARGEVLVPMDADLQNDPADIERLLAKLDEGYDVVSGWRAARQDGYLTRVLPSRLANWLVSWIGGVPLHDYGCSLKAYRREVLKDVHLYGEMHRFIPIYASWAGGRVTEIPVAHHPRAAGQSKYGLSRTVKVVFDLITIKFMASYLTKPLYVFGWAGILAFGICAFSAALACLMKFASWPHHADFIQTPLPVLAMITLVLGIQLFLMGLIAEMSVRTYHESQNKPIYTVRTKINFSESDE